MKKLIVALMMLGLAGFAKADVVDDFDGGQWEDGDGLYGGHDWISAGWPNCVVSNVVGYLGSFGVTVPFDPASYGRAQKSLGETITSGVYKISGLLKTNQEVNGKSKNAYLGLWSAPDEDGIVVAFKKARIDKISYVGTDSYEVQTNVALAALGWYEGQITFDLDSDSATVRVRDVPDDGIGAPGAWQDLGDFDRALPFNVTHAMVGVYYNGIIDNVNAAPLPSRPRSACFSVVLVCLSC